jgi:medium-chain acyl-[acyl-carrier-protein] hydrolase
MNRRPDQRRNEGVPDHQGQVRLFCFPFSGAGASIFHKWREILPPAIELFPVQLPGRENRLSEPLITDMDTLVRDSAEAILPYLGKPFAFFGHSMGALLSFELARYLQRHCKLMPVHLFMSGHAAPQVSYYESPIHDLPDAEFTKKINELNGTPPEVWEHPELRQLLMPILRADFTICETYSYKAGEPLPCSITAMTGLADPYLDRADLEAWQTQTINNFTVRMFPGDHFYLNQERSLLLRILAQELLNIHGKL